MPEDLFQLGIKALIRNARGEVLLLQVNTDSLLGHEGGAYWDIPGGRVHRGQSIEETLLREIEEETGLTEIAIAGSVGQVLSNIRIPRREGGDTGLILWVYECRIEEESEIRLSSEHGAYEWVNPAEAGERLAFKYPPEFTEKIKGLANREAGQ